MKKLIIFIALLLISTFAFSVDVIVSAPEGIFQYELEDIEINAEEGLVFITRTHRIVIPTIYFGRLEQIVFQADDFFNSTEPREGYVIIMQGRIDGVNYLLVNNVNSDKIEAQFSEFRLHMYWNNVRPAIAELMGDE